MEANISQENEGYAIVPTAVGFPDHPKKDWVNYFDRQPIGYESCHIEIDIQTMKRLLQMFKSNDPKTVELAIAIFKKRNFSQETIKNSQCILDMMYKAESYVNKLSERNGRDMSVWPMTAYVELLFRTKD